MDTLSHPLCPLFYNIFKHDNIDIEFIKHNTQVSNMRMSQDK